MVEIKSKHAEGNDCANKKQVRVKDCKNSAQSVRHEEFAQKLLLTPKELCNLVLLSFVGGFCWGLSSRSCSAMEKLA